MAAAACLERPPFRIFLPKASSPSITSSHPFSLMTICLDSLCQTRYALPYFGGIWLILSETLAEPPIQLLLSQRAQSLLLIPYLPPAQEPCLLSRCPGSTHLASSTHGQSGLCLTCISWMSHSLQKAGSVRTLFGISQFRKG